MSILYTITYHSHLLFRLFHTHATSIFFVYMGLDWPVCVLFPIIEVVKSHLLWGPYTVSRLYQAGGLDLMSLFSWHERDDGTCWTFPWHVYVITVSGSFPLSMGKILSFFSEFSPAWWSRPRKLWMGPAYPEHLKHIARWILIRLKFHVL